MEVRDVDNQHLRLIQEAISIVMNGLKLYRGSVLLDTFETPESTEEFIKERRN